MLHAGDLIELSIERPAAGGRMIARHDGQIVLVSGTMPGERVTARVERVERRLAFARPVDVIDASPDRRASAGDPLCGGCLYSHIQIERQRAIKGEVIADAFARIGKHPLTSPADVAASPERGYRMRARLHVREGRAGFYREGSHDLCDAAATGQLYPETLAAVTNVIDAFESAGLAATSLEIAENIPADQRAVFVELAPRGRLSKADLGPLTGTSITSVSAVVPGGARYTAGQPEISDSLSAITMGRAKGELRRTAESFFQANRFLLPQLVTTVIDNVLPDGDVLDLYAGVGLFAVSLAGSGRSALTAVEAPGASGADLQRNAAPFAGSLTAVVAPVERYLARVRQLPATVIVDPPRTGLSKTVVDHLSAHGGVRLVYVSCDPPTLARDARVLLDGGYQLTSIRAFDLFPNTPHVEAVGVFDRS
jgi:tRNA/tmRNA/rRNA uracil-C5-methylase (TrmA/RlmC/RlmD family)